MADRTDSFPCTLAGKWLLRCRWLANSWGHRGMYIFMTYSYTFLSLLCVQLSHICEGIMMLVLLSCFWAVCMYNILTLILSVVANHIFHYWTVVSSACCCVASALFIILHTASSISKFTSTFCCTWWTYLHHKLPWVGSESQAYFLHSKIELQWRLYSSTTIWVD